MSEPIVRAHEGKEPVLGEGVYLAPTSVVIGDAQLADHVSVWFQSVVRADVGSIRIGKRTNIQDLTMIHVTGGEADTDVGQDVTVGHRVVLHGCRVEDGCLVGMGSVLLDGCVIGEGSVVGAGALVTPGTEIPPRSLVLGSPAKVVRSISDAEAELAPEGVDAYLELAEIYRREP